MAYGHILKPFPPSPHLMDLFRSPLAMRLKKAVGAIVNRDTLLY